MSEKPVEEEEGKRESLMPIILYGFFCMQ